MTKNLPHFVILSGPLCAGKTMIARYVSRRLGLDVFGVRATLTRLAGKRGSRRGDLQEFGLSLEKRTRGRWLADALAEYVDSRPSLHGVVVDSARTIGQTLGVRRLKGVVFHLHVTAAKSMRRERYDAQMRKERDHFDSAGFDRTVTHPIEVLSERAAACADAVLDTTRLPVSDMRRLALSRIRKGLAALRRSRVGWRI